jgi:hypothetical protein
MTVRVLFGQLIERGLSARRGVLLSQSMLKMLGLLSMIRWQRSLHLVGVCMPKLVLDV